jgi:hypothetical protein
MCFSLKSVYKQQDLLCQHLRDGAHTVASALELSHFCVLLHYGSSSQPDVTVVLHWLRIHVSLMPTWVRQEKLISFARLLLPSMVVEQPKPHK